MSVGLRSVACVMLSRYFVFGIVVQNYKIMVWLQLFGSPGAIARQIIEGTCDTNVEQCHKCESCTNHSITIKVHELNTIDF